MDLPKNPTQEATTGDLFSSGKLVAEAAQATFSNQADKIDKASVADAAGDLLGAASKYGHIEQTSYGNYVEKAEDYLHQYKGTTDGPPAAATTTPTDTAAVAAPAATETPAAETKPEGGVGDVLKMAKGAGLKIW